MSSLDAGADVQRDGDGNRAQNIPHSGPLPVGEGTELSPTIPAEDGAESEQSRMPIGTTKGPGETPQEFLFISPDHDQRLKVGEFVYYVAPQDPAQRPIFGRIVGRQPVRLYPDEFMADPNVAPQAMAELFGYEGDGELFEIAVRTLGYFDERLRAFVNPRIAPRVGWSIYLASDAMLATVLNKLETGQVGAVHVGSLLSREPDAVPVVLAGRDFTSTHLAIVASTGSGKSYLAAVIVEELMKPHNRACVLVVDPHAEYDTLAHMTRHPAFRGSDGYEPVVRVLRPSDVHVRFSTLRLGDLRQLIDMTERMEHVLGVALRALSRRKRDETGSADLWTPDDLMREIQRYAAQKKEEDDAQDFRSTAGALEWRLEQLLSNARILDATRHLDLRNLFQPGQCTVLQLDEVDQREQQVVVAVLLRRLYQARQDTDRQRIHHGHELYLPYPAFVLLEEAHHFAPAGDGGNRVVSADILRTILAEGRKFGVGVGLISQRPGKLDQDALSQCMTQIMLRIVNPIDQTNVAAAVEGASRDVLDELPSLSKGQAVIVGQSVNAPVLVAVRERHTPHGGQDLDAPRIWVDYNNPMRRAERDRDTAPLVSPTPENRLYYPERPSAAPSTPKTFEELFGPEETKK